MTQPGTTVRVNHSCCLPCPPSGGTRSRSCEIGCQVVVAVVRIGHHREIPSHVDTGDKDRLDVVTVSSLAGERYPRVEMLFRILFESPLSLNVFPVSQMFSQKGGALMSRELERDGRTRCQRPGAHVRGSGGNGYKGTHSRISIRRYPERRNSGFSNGVRRKIARRPRFGVENRPNI